MANLITITDIQTLKPLSSNTDITKKVNPFILEAQRMDLRPILGDEFYLALEADVLASPSLVTYTDLWNGSNYTIGTKTYINYGLKAVLIYYSYARYLNRSNTNSTAFGMVKKSNPDSEPLSEKTLSRLVAQAISGAKLYENNVKKYLDNNASTYPLYDCVYNNKKSNGFRITGIR